MNQESTATKVMNCIAAYAEQSERDGNLIAILHKTASEVTAECTKLREKVEQLQGEAQVLRKQASELSIADKGAPKLDETVLREHLSKLADDAVLDKATIDAHIAAAKEDPVGHMGKMIGVLQKELHRVKTAADTELSPVGYPRGSTFVNTSGRKTDNSFERANRVRTDDALDHLESELANY